MTDATDISVGSRAGFTVIRPGERLGAPESEELADILDPLVRQKNAQILFDMATLEFISSRSIGVLMAARSEARRRRGRIILSNLSPTVARVLAMTRVDECFEIVANAEEMLARSEKLIQQSGADATNAGR